MLELNRPPKIEPFYTNLTSNIFLQFHDTYCKICSKRKVSQLGQEDFLGLCNILETRGLLGIKRAKATRMMKVTLKIDEKEVDYALQDKTLLSSILQEGMPTDSKH